MSQQTASTSRRLALLISYITHPLWTPFVVAVLVHIYWPGTGEMAYLIQGYAASTALTYLFVGSVLLPLALFALLMRTGKIQSMHMRSASERLLPSLILMLIYSTGIYIFSHLITAPILYYICLMAASLTAINYIIIRTLKFKISLHTMGISSLSSICVGLYLMHIMAWSYLLLILLLAIAVGMARLILKAHTPLQVVAGYLVGMLLGYALMHIPSFFVLL